MGDYRPLDPTAGGCFAYLRTLDGELGFGVVLNFSSQEAILEHPDLAGGKVVLSTYLDRREPSQTGKSHLASERRCDRLARQILSIAENMS